MDVKEIVCHFLDKFVMKYVEQSRLGVSSHQVVVAFFQKDVFCGFEVNFLCTLSALLLGNS